MVFTITCGMNQAKAYGVTQMDRYGIFCEYKSEDNQTYFFQYFADAREDYFDLETDFDQLGISIEEGRPGKPLTDNKEIKWLQEKGLVDSELKFTCPETDPFGVSGLVLETKACSEWGCQIDVVPSTYETFSCNYSNTSGNKLIIDYESNAEYPNGKWKITYPDGITETRTISTISDGTLLPDSSCPDLYYVPSTRIIRGVYFGNNLFCKNYQNETQYFCNSGRCAEKRLTCKNTGSCDLGDIPRALPIFISNIVKLIKILVPILLIILGMLDFVRAVISSDEKQMKEAQGRFIRRLIAGGFIFFVFAIVQFIFGAIKTDNNVLNCVDYFINGDSYADRVNTCIDKGKTKCETECSTSDDYDACYDACFKKENAECRGYTGCASLLTKEECNIDSSCLWIASSGTCKPDTCANRCAETCYNATGSHTSGDFFSCKNSCEAACKS